MGKERSEERTRFPSLPERRDNYKGDTRQESEPPPPRYAALVGVSANHVHGCGRLNVQHSTGQLICDISGEGGVMMTAIDARFS